MNRALFLDRDGIVNVDGDHLYRIEDIKFIPGVFDLCRHFQESGYLIIVITNQAGIARGLYSEEDFDKLTRWMAREFDKRGIRLTKVYHCSHHPDFTGQCECRKPAPGLFLQAGIDFDIDLGNSINLGDKRSDVEAGLNAGVKNNILLHNGLDPFDESSGFRIIRSFEELIGRNDDLEHSTTHHC